MWYFIRVTTDNTSKEELAELVKEPYIISKEYSRRMKLHYHILTESGLEKEQVKELFYQKFPYEPKGVRTLKVDVLGDTIGDVLKTGAYTVKDGDYIYSDFFDEYIEEILSLSYKKPEAFSKAQKKLIEEFTATDYEKIDFQKLKVQIAILRAQYGLEIYKTKIEALVLSVQISMNHNVAEELFSFE